MRLLLVEENNVLLYEMMGSIVGENNRYEWTRGVSIMELNVGTSETPGVLFESDYMLR